MGGRAGEQAHRRMRAPSGGVDGRADGYTGGLGLWASTRTGGRADGGGHTGRTSGRGRTMGGRADRRTGADERTGQRIDGRVGGLAD